jgi:DNA topoisomerase-2
MLGLRTQVDYSKIENLLTLRYGFVLICTDADSDGTHIAALLINYFDTCFPGLLHSGRIGILRTPVVRIMNTKGEIKHRFFTTAEFEKWSTENMINGEMPKGLERPVYFKGLGKSDDFEIKDDLTTAPVVTVLYDEDAANSLSIAFHKDLSKSRKEWISKWRDATDIQDIQFVGTGVYRKQKITDYINHELIEYTKDALFRAIPSMDDGLKRSHRQALYAALKQFNYGKKKDLMGVARFAAFAANETNYHHGETSMCDTIVKMTQEYVGSNNLPFFKGKGQFGTRHSMGDDAASPRYLSVNLPEYTSYLYDKEAIECIPKRVIEGDEVEPMYLPAIIPMHLVNGVNGIATGWRTFAPNHNYYDVISWFKERCLGNENPNKGDILKPWYRGFTGKIDFVNSDHLDIGSNGLPLADREVNDDEDDDTDNINGLNTSVIQPKGLSLRTRGKFREVPMKDKRTIYISEIAVGTPIGDYRKWLDLQVTEDFISDVRDTSTTEIPKFEIMGYPVPESKVVTYKALHLDRYYPMTNITLIDTDGYPTTFEHTTQVMEVYYKKMISLYAKVKHQRLTDIKAKIEDLTFKIRFIAAVLNDTIKIFKRKKIDVLADMATQNPPIPEKYYTNAKFQDVSQEDIEEAYAEITKLTELFKVTEKMTPEQLWFDKLVALETFLRKNKY